MRHIKITIPHSLSQETALERIKELMTDLQKKHASIISNVSENWDGTDGQFVFSAKGFTIAGKFKVSENSVSIESKLPFLLSFYSDKIKGLIKAKGEELLKNHEVLTEQ